LEASEGGIEVEGVEGVVSAPPRHFEKPKEKYTATSKALITEKGYERLEKMYEAADNRVPELNGITHIYSDYAGYGTVEVIEKQVRD
jgi:hypothetical protein